MVQLTITPFQFFVVALLLTAFIYLLWSTLMSAISDFAAKQAAHNKIIDDAIDGLVADNQWFRNKIAELQNSPGEITQEDQALLDQLEAKANQQAGRLRDLDLLTPPAVIGLPTEINPVGAPGVPTPPASVPAESNVPVETDTKVSDVPPQSPNDPTVQNSDTTKDDGSPKD